ncbi:MAG TPA: cell division ATP-binding protein FtsE [Bacillota bacterium]|nr:cell division ATP-binding protein FtsE [Clostridiaceae bacterium]HNR04630.1 cell division ATP-binding protein FtsE [Bacillota bacterium]HNT03982.1 cell division ATP-binding protein FtsE [Bacillota bacterium]HPL98974.1 cell division ATP-binding protein FtsE [Bacillota bacterium]HPX69771.1 cell division ATP-binding protein FtsE [Bacillota bacterium]
MIQLRSVSKEFADGNKVLRNINLTINNGEFVFLVGSSGAGKSTIIKLLLKEMEPTTGTIIVGDKDITKYKRREIPFHRRNIGVVFQDFRLLQEKTVYENVAFAMEVIEAPPKEIRRQVPIILSMVGLSKKAGLYPQQLSGGEQQRVSLARAMVNSPSILIADEPTGNLDPDMSWDIMKTLSEINQRGTTVLMATHASDIVDKMKKRVVEIENGIITRDEMKGGYSSEA